MSLAVYVFGPGVGESIVLRLPSGEWAVVDAYASGNRADSASDIVDFLRSRNVERLRFVCWTHPHEDHSNGFPALLHAFSGRIGEFWRFDSPAPPILFGRASAWQRRAGIQEEHYLVQVAEHFTLRLDRVKLVRTGVSLLSLPDHDFEIRGLCPSDRAKLVYERQIGRYGSSLLDGLSPEAPNDNYISAAVWLRYGQSQVVLGGDVVRSAWRSARRAADQWPRDVVVVKASHHGSVHSYHPHIWREWCSFGGIGRIVVVTPYEPLQKPLPTDEGLALLQQHGEVVVTGRSELPSRFVEPSPEDDDWSAIHLVSEPAASPPPRAPGPYWVRLDSNGHIVRQGYF